MTSALAPWPKLSTIRGVARRYVIHVGGPDGRTLCGRPTGTVALWATRELLDHAGILPARPRCRTCLARCDRPARPVS